MALALGALGRADEALTAAQEAQRLAPGDAHIARLVRQLQVPSAVAEVVPVRHR